MLPRLGDCRATFRQQLGSPRIDHALGEPTIEAFTYRGVPVMVLFVHDQAAAIRCPYERYQPRMFVCPVQVTDAIDTVQVVCWSGEGRSGCDTEASS
jgi:hypothetical protein